MVDLTTLGRKELLEEFKVIISEWEQSLEKKKSLEDEIRNLKSQKVDILSDINAKIRFNQRVYKYEKMKKTTNTFSKVWGTILGILIWVLGFRILMHLFSDNSTKIFIDLGIFLLSFIIPVILSACIMSGPTKDKEKALEEKRVLVEQNSEIKAIENKIKELEEKIPTFNDNFQEFRQKRNNFSRKYYGHEYRFRDYLESGRANNLKEAIEAFENDLHREEVLNIQRNTNQKIQNMSSSLSQQLLQQSQQLSQKLSQQSEQIADLQSTVNSLDV